MAGAAVSALHRPGPILSPRTRLIPADHPGLIPAPSTARSPFIAIQWNSHLRMVHARARRGFPSVKNDEVATPTDLYFDLPLKILEYPHPVLREKSKRIVTFDGSLKNLVEEMFDIMYKTDGIGLSAPQVGVSVQLLVFNPVGERGKGEEIVLINPRIFKYSKNMVLFTEGCLSFPGICADVERPESVKIDALDITGARFAINLSGLPARIFQHEFDHLQGTLFFDRMDEENLESICADLENLEEKYEERTGLLKPESIKSNKAKKVAAGFGKRGMKI